MESQLWLTDNYILRGRVLTHCFAGSSFHVSNIIVITTSLKNVALLHTIERGEHKISAPFMITGKRIGLGNMEESRRY